MGLFLGLSYQQDVDKYGKNVDNYRKCEQIRTFLIRINTCSIYSQYIDNINKNYRYNFYSLFLCSNI